MFQEVIEFKNILEQLDISMKERIDILSKFETLLEEKASPDFAFDFLKNGVFKEVYWLDSTHKYVIKFCCEHNETESELSILQQVTTEISKVFIQTFSLHLIRTIPASFILVEEREGMDDEEDTLQINYILIQPAIDKTCSTDFDHISLGSSKLYMRNPLVVNNSIINYEYIKGAPITNKVWLQKIVQYYGEEFLILLKDFIDEKCIGDLHDGNIGYLNDRPVIIDYL